MIFIAGINRNNQPKGGQEAKNQILLDYLFKHEKEVVVIDTYNWKKRLGIIMYQVFTQVLFKKNQRIYLSLSSDSAYYLLRLMNSCKVLKRNEVHFFVVGGTFHQWIKNKSTAIFSQLKGIYPESIEMCKSIENLGYTNILHIPNFRKRSNQTIGNEPNSFSEKRKFIFFSRIIASKGCTLLLEAATILNEKYKNNYTIDFYGPMDEVYQHEFESKLANLPNCSYKGYLDLSQSVGYQLLSTYDMMVFPTFYEGEGYPGVLIDAIMAKVPAIASDWHFNKEIIQNDKNGILIEPHSLDNLINAMIRVINEYSVIEKLKKGVVESQATYDIEQLLEKIPYDVN